LSRRRHPLDPEFGKDEMFACRAMRGGGFRDSKSKVGKSQFGSSKAVYRIAGRSCEAEMANALDGRNESDNLQ